MTVLELYRDLYEHCRELINAPHPDHFASRLGDEENDAMNKIKAVVTEIDKRKGRSK